MYFSALVSITLLAAATVGASSSDTDRGISITIAKRNTSPNGTIDAFKLMTQNNHTIA
jgi:hypothetical protein